jgi:hypothetical protein
MKRNHCGRARRSGTAFKENRAKGSGAQQRIRVDTKGMKGSQFSSESSGTKTPSWLSKRLRAINICLRSGFAEEALTLLYSAIDTLGFLAAPANASSQIDTIAGAAHI